MRTYTFNLKDLFISFAAPVRRNDEGKTVIQQCDVELRTKGSSFHIIRREVLKQLLDYCYESSNNKPLSKSEFNFMYRNCIEHKPSSFSLKAIIHDAIYDAANVDITFIATEENTVVQIPQKKPLELDDIFFTTCRDTLSSVINARRSTDYAWVIFDAYAKKEMIKLNVGQRFCDVFTAYISQNTMIQITQQPKRYVLTVRNKCGDGFVQPVAARSVDGLVSMENNDILYTILDETFEQLDKEIYLGNMSKLADKKAWNKYSHNLWFSDKNKLEHENYLFFL